MPSSEKLYISKELCYYNKGSKCNNNVNKDWNLSLECAVYKRFTKFNIHHLMASR